MHIYFHHLTTWFLVLVVLLQRIQGDQHLAKDCLEYSFGVKNISYRTPNVSLGDVLEMSLQMTADGQLPLIQINLYEEIPHTNIIVNQENMTLNYGDKRKHLTLARPQSPFSWTNLVLDTSVAGTLLVYTPMDRMNALTADVTTGSLAFVSSNEAAHVAFNCLSGCLIHTSSSALIQGNVTLQPPFTMYLNPFILPITPVLLTADNGVNVTVNSEEWTEDKWHRVEINVKAENQQEEETTDPFRNGTDNVPEVLIWVRNASYRITRLKGFRWTLHCAPEGLLDIFSSTNILDPGTNTDGEVTSTPISENGEGTETSGGGKEGGKSKRKGGAGAGMVTAWVMAGLALFLVLVLTLALCTKTSQSSNPNQFPDSQPSVGIVYCKGAYREPEEDSEPESPNELKVPTYRTSHKQFSKTYKEVDD